MRDGDWRSREGLGVAVVEGYTGDSADGAAGDRKRGDAGGGEMDGGDDEGDEGDEDWRVEATSEYLPPEVLSGESMPTVSSDAYALGVTIFQVLAGRMPDPERMWGASGSTGGGGHVRFSGNAGAAAAGETAGGGFPRNFPSAAADLVRGLLHPDPQQRLGGGQRGLEEVCEHPWFAPLLPPASVRSGGAKAALQQLYRQASPAAVPGLASAAETAGTWSRRHYSSMFAPMPRAYTTFLAAGSPAGSVSSTTATGRAGDDDASASSEAPRSISLRDCLSLESFPPLLPP
jgi:serine/threonine protein kinase